MPIDTNFNIEIFKQQFKTRKLIFLRLNNIDVFFGALSCFEQASKAKHLRTIVS